LDTAEIDETSYKLSGDFLANSASAILLESFRRSMALEHKLHPLLCEMVGMSGRKYRYLINNLIEETKDPRYLEIGSWAGSTACAAIFRNQVAVTCIDNWAEFGGPKDVFLANIQACKNEQVNFNFIERDFRDVDYSRIGKYNVYMFDGPHGEQDQYDGVVIAQPALEAVYTLIVDDWNWSKVRTGTMRALADTSTTLICSIDIRSTQTNLEPRGAKRQHSAWHNGYLLAVCKKGI
jgi:hypothetical protein